jgi:hypothetical protein
MNNFKNSNLRSDDSRTRPAGTRHKLLSSKLVMKLDADTEKSQQETGGTRAKEKSQQETGGTRAKNSPVAIGISGSAVACCSWRSKLKQALGSILRRAAGFESQTEKLIDLSFEAQPRNTHSSSLCARCKPHTASPDLSIVQSPSIRPMLDHHRSCALGLLLLPRSLSLSIMSHLSPTHHEISKRDPTHEQI